MTGINTLFDAELADYALRQIDQLSNANLIILGDIEIGFVGSTQSLEGSAVFASAGSVIAIFSKGSVRRLGGWGPAFTDDGSSYQMGRDALRLVADWSDHKRISTGTFRYSESTMDRFWNSIDLWMRYPGSFCEFPDEGQVSGWADIAVEWRRIRRLFLISNRHEDLPLALVAFSYGVLRESVPAWWNFVASLSIPIVKYWQSNEISDSRNDPTTEIVERFINELSKRYQQVSMPVRDELSGKPCVFCGGLLNHHPRLARKLYERIELDSGSGFCFTHLDDGSTCRPAIGALLLALGRSTQSNLRVPALAAINHVKDQLADSTLKWSEILENG
jgi:N-acetylglucosamine kinase-like BadF-type ATPase